jgi:membrane protease YdiL (CAAX protease family)
LIPPAALRGFGPAGLFAIVLILLAGNWAVGGIIVPAGAILVLVWRKLSDTPWPAIGYARPSRWARTIVLGIALGIALKLLMKSVVMPLFGANPVNQAYHYLAGNTAMLPAAIWAMLMAGFGEETVFRGWAFERLGKLLGSGTRARIAILLITSAWFGAAHIANQGRDGAINAAFTGLAFGAIYLRTGTIWMPMIAHAFFDFTALAMIYFDVEAHFAHLFID